MTSDFWTHEMMKDFDRLTLTPDQLAFIKTRLVNMTRRGGTSVYLVMAMPEGAKVKTSRDRRQVSVWPETCLGMISKVRGRPGQASWWDIFPCTRNSEAFYKKSIGQVPGREVAATKLLVWWTTENAKRLPGNSGVAVEDPERNDLAEKMFEAYMLTYDSFSTDTNEVMEVLDIPRTFAQMIGKRLESAGLIVREKVEGDGGMQRMGGNITQSRERGRYAPDMWQCCETYDSIDRLQAIDRYVECAGKYAESASASIANEAKITRKDKIDVYGRIK